MNFAKSALNLFIDEAEQFQFCLSSTCSSCKHYFGGTYSYNLLIINLAWSIYDYI